MGFIFYALRKKEGLRQPNMDQDNGQNPMPEEMEKKDGEMGQEGAEGGEATM
jgi:hypothetical protein